MSLPVGVYRAQKKDSTIYYRASITYKNKHISLGSYSCEHLAHNAYQIASKVLYNDAYIIENYQEGQNPLSFHKWVVLINYRDNGMYIKNPIYMKHRYFIYYLDKDRILKFDVDDLFYYSTHKIMCRGGHLFVSDYGMQVNILSRYGIKNYAVVERDYRFVNGDDTDYRYGNIEIINKYHGVTRIEGKGHAVFLSKIHVNGDTIIGRYPSEAEAAIAYNKAADLLLKQGVHKNFIKNYIYEVDEIEYARIYHRIRISKNIRDFQGFSNPPLEVL